MNQEIKERWAAALESGEFKQGTQQLAVESVIQDPVTGRPVMDADGKYVVERHYCCLGVLCELARRDGVVATYRDADAHLPRAVSDWAELPDGRPEVPVEALQDGDTPSWPDLRRNIHSGLLDVLNDNGCTFNRIAALIREHL